MLTTDVVGPVRVVWEDTERSRKRLGRGFDRLRTLLEQVAHEREDFGFELDLRSGTR